MGHSDIRYHGSHGEEDWEVTLADTGDRTMTGGRVHRAAAHLADGDEDFFLTYGDGVANIDIDRLLSCHRDMNKELTLTAVRPASRFGELKIDAGVVTDFDEKSKAGANLINGGFMVAKLTFVDRFLDNDPSLVLEQGPIEAAMAAGEVAAYKHPGFWQCMDTRREYALLNSLWDSGERPWTEAW